MRLCLIDFGVVFLFFFTALTDSQGWTPTSSEGVHPPCVQATKPEVCKKKT